MISLSEYVGGADAALFVIQQRISPGQDLIGVQGSCQHSGMAQTLLPGALCGCGSSLQLLAVCVQPCFPVRCCAAGHIARKRLLHLHKLIIAYIQATLDIILNIFF